MKKVLFFAAMVAALSMAFVACGKKENKNPEDLVNALENALEEEMTKFEKAVNVEYKDEPIAPAYEEEEAAPAPAPVAAPAPVNNNVDLREYYVSAFEAAVAAGDYEKAYQISMEAEQKVNPEDFTPEQVQRVMNAAALIPQDFIESKGM